MKPILYQMKYIHCTESTWMERRTNIRKSLIACCFLSGWWKNYSAQKYATQKENDIPFMFSLSLQFC